MPSLSSYDFSNQLNATVGDADGALGAARVQSALDSVDLAQISPSEKHVLLSMAGGLAADGRISDSDATTLVSLIRTFSGNGPSLPIAHAPIQAPGAGYPGSALFGAALTQLGKQVAQSFQDHLFSDTAQGMLGHAADSMYNDDVSCAIDEADLSKLSAGDRATALNMIGFAAADGQITRVEAASIRDFLKFAQGETSQTGAAWSVNQADGAHATIDLGNYTLTLDQGNSQFELTNKATGQKTTVWGDPHLREGNTEVGTFKGTLSMVLDDGTKITINTTPAGNGEYYSSKLTITQGDQALVVDNLNQNAGKGLSISRSPVFGQMLDWTTDDGTRIYEDADNNNWAQLQNGGWTTPVDGNFLAQA
jgi:hypothetical protein